MRDVSLDVPTGFLGVLMPARAAFAEIVDGEGVIALAAHDGDLNGTDARRREVPLGGAPLDHFGTPAALISVRAE